MDALVIDAFEFCRVKDSRAGENPITDFPRLTAEALSPDGMLKWSLTGGTHEAGHLQLVLHVSGAIRLECQRCLGPLDFPIDSRSELVLATDEQDADRIEELLEDEDVEVIVGSRQLNIVDLIEDEVLLAIPPAPKHEECEADKMPEAPVSKAPSPFDALKKWKQ